MTNDEPYITRNSRGEYRYREGRWFPAWALLMVPFVVMALPLLRYAGGRMNWKSLGFTIAIFEGLLVPVERLCLKRGHWVYNESRLLGPRIFGVPIEEPLIYYLLSPVIILLIFQSFLKAFEEGQ
jgi:lycopene cyclase domain-containing protein